MSDLGNKEVLAKNLKYYMDIHDLKPADLGEALGFPYTTVVDWLKANTYPRIDKIEMLANYFSIDKSDLIEVDRKRPDHVTGPKSELRSELDKYIDNFDEARLKLMLERAQMLYQMRNQEE